MSVTRAGHGDRAGGRVAVSDGTDPPTPRSAVEVDFPVRRVNALAASESYNKHHYRPTNYQHKWWARRLGSVFRTVCLSALAGADTTADEVWRRYAESNDVGDAVVLDPFMGGGTTGQEATRLGAKFVGSDLNPVAWYIARMGLAPQTSSLELYFRRVMNQSADDIRPYYQTRCPVCDEPAAAQFYLWVEHDPENCRRTYDSLVVDHDSDGGATVVCPSCHSISGSDDPEQSTCEYCGHSFDASKDDVDVVVDEPRVLFGGGDRPAYEPYAVKYVCDCGSGFRAFDAFDAERYEAAQERLAEVRDDLPLPTQSIPRGGEKTRDLHNRNYTSWTDLFNDRQLLALGRLLDNVRNIDDETARQYLMLTFSATLEFNNMFCSYKGADPRGPGAVRHIFSHHAYVHPSEPLENNPLGALSRQSGTFRYLYEYRLKKALDFQRNPVERVLDDDGTVAEKRSIDGERIGGTPADSVGELVDGDATHYLHCGDSADLDLEEVTVDAVVTDPPYYDSVQYAELADFFYVWLKQGLERDFPEVFASDSVVSEAEAVGNRSRDKSLEDYQRLLGSAFRTAVSALAPDGPVVFTFHHKQADAWGAVLDAVTDAGLRVVATYPVRGENRLSVHINGQRAIQLDSVIVCRKYEDETVRRWSEVRNRIERAARERLEQFHRSDDQDLSVLDASVVVRGTAMCHLSANDVHDADGPLSATEAMRRLDDVIDRLNEQES
jgi:adenine-specific DNA methylase